MTNLIDDALRAPTPQQLESRTPLVELAKSAQAELLRAAMLDNNVEGSSSHTELRRYALWLDSVLSSSGYSDQPVMELSSTLFEFAGRLSPFDPTTIFRPPLNDLLRATFLSSMTPFRNRAQVTARRMSDIFAGLTPTTELDKVHFDAGMVIVSLLGRRFHDAISYHARMRSAYLDLVRNSETDFEFEPDLRPVHLAQAIATGAKLAAEYMLTGLGDLVQQAYVVLETAREAAIADDDSNRYWLADRLKLSIERMHQSSVHVALGRKVRTIPEEFRQALMRDGFFELWGPQIQAVEQGIAAPSPTKNLVAAIPTGSGKSLLAEIAVLAALHNNHGWVAYVAPSRSLVVQASQDLKRHLQPCGIEVSTVLAGAEQSIVLEEELDFIRHPRTALVTTPEKFDTYVRNAPQILDSCHLLVVDEIHKIADETRGALIESLVTQFQLLRPDGRIVLLSGVLSNSEEFVSWLDSDKTISVVEQRRATRQVHGVAVRQSRVKEGKPRTKVVKKAGFTKEIRRVDFDGGITLVHENQDLSGPIKVDLSNAFQGHYFEKRTRTGWAEDTFEAGSSINKHAVELAQRLSASPGTVLVFVNQTGWAESCANAVKIDNSDFRKERERLSRFIAAELGDEHSLVESCLTGIAFHHARLPSSIQRAIEFALEQGWLKIVFATSSLREGINSAATVVIIAGQNIWDGSNKSKLRIADFANMAGRAGRPRIDTEGLVLLVPNSLAQSSAIEAGREYILQGESALRVVSQLEHLRTVVEGTESIFTRLPVGTQRLFLGLRAMQLHDLDSVLTFFDQTLWARQELENQTVSSVAESVYRSMALAEEEMGERFLLAAKLGFSLTSAELLRTSLIDQKGLFTEEAGQSNEIRHQRLHVLVSAALSLEESYIRVDEPITAARDYLDPLKSWIDGSSYTTILDQGKQNGLFKSTAKLGDAVRLCSVSSNYFSWAFGAAWAILSNEIDDVDPELGMLPLLVRYGVPTASAAYVSLLGVTDRTASRKLGQTYDLTGRQPSLSAIAEWLDEIDVDEVFPEASHHLTADLLRRSTIARSKTIAPYSVARFRSFAQHENAHLSILSSQGRLLLVQDGRIVGEVLPDDPVAIRLLTMNRANPPIVSIVQESTARNLGTLVVVPPR